ncbi:MAG: hypothetical protein QOD31_4070 [Pseudonocardiales bacterium]|nr:hypothetical protein [Pseudonocardiales bacterium]
MKQPRSANWASAFLTREPAEKVRFFYDCEFIEDGTTIELVSIGVVDEQGREFYAVSTEFDPTRAIDWVRRNVLDKLPPPADPAWRSLERIRRDLLAFLTEPDEPIELWAWMSAYDHVALAQLWGDMRALPRVIPRFTHELRQRWEDAGSPPLPAAPTDQHDALADARHNLARWRVLGASSPPPSTPSLPGRPPSPQVAR